MNMSVAVIGAGNGGTAIAAYMASQGAEVNLSDLFPQYFLDSLWPLLKTQSLCSAG